MTATYGRRRPIRIATYNIHKCVGPDRKHKPERIFEVLRSLKADLIAVQEFDSRRRPGRGRISVADFETALDCRAIAQPTIDGPGGFHGNLLLSRMPLKRIARLDISAPRAEYRGAILARTEERSSGTWVVATHLGLDPFARRHQIKRLIAGLTEAAGPVSSTPVAVLGDFNEWLPFLGSRPLMRQSFHAPDLPKTFPSRLPLLALDQIWASSRLELRSVRTADTPEAREASDHLPVVAEISVR